MEKWSTASQSLNLQQQLDNMTITENKTRHNKDLTHDSNVGNKITMMKNKD